MDFLLAVQTGVLLAVLGEEAMKWQKGVLIIGAAAGLPEEALPDDVGSAAVDFLESELSSANKKPAWLLEHEENNRKVESAAKDLVRIALNPAYEGSLWWLYAEAEAAQIPRSCVPIVCDRLKWIEVSRADAEQFCAWGEMIPGWEDEPFVLVNVSDGSSSSV